MMPRPAWPGRDFEGGHETVKHAVYEWARGDVHVNNCESFHGLLRRGILGSFHHVSQKHLHRYCDEFAWRWNRRGVSDASLTEDALRQTEGRRLTYESARG